jgi:integrative and conjugative element protein (TIGR02256 family)
MRKLQVGIRLHVDARRAIAAAAAAGHPKETGGVLLGWWDDGNVVVRDAIEVADPFATTDSWSRDHDRSQLALDGALALHKHPWLGYVGDWHSHPAPCGPSSQDHRSIRHASRQYDHPIVLLIHRTDGAVDVVAANRGRAGRATLLTGREERGSR